VAPPQDLAERLEIRVDRSRLTFLAAVLLLTGSACLFHYPPWTRSWWLGCLALVLVPSVMSRRNDRRPLLVLDEDGLLAPRTGVGWIAWSDIRRVRIQRVAHAHFLCVAIEDADRYLGPLSRWRAFWLAVSLGRVGRELRVDLSFTDVSAQEIFEEVSRRCEATEQPGGRDWN